MYISSSSTIPSSPSLSLSYPNLPSNSDLECLWFNSTCKGDSCSKSSISKCSTRIKDEHGPYRCFVVWTNSTEAGVSVRLSGCVSGKDYQCNDHSQCIEHNTITKAGLFFCCCSSNQCNREFQQIARPTLITSEPDPTQATPTPNLDSNLFWLSIYILIPTFILLGILLIFNWYRRNKSQAFNEDLGNSDESVPINEQSFYRFKNLEFIEEKSRGRFGAVWKARLSSGSGFIDDKWVAVKVFPAHEKNSWLTEQQVFMLPKFEHENILPFLGFEKREKDNVPFGIEYWIISEYHELGSLHDYLKSNTIGFNDLLKMCDGIARGLAHLHGEIPSAKNVNNKPAIAHRDFKSKNVLLKSDLTPRIADFGLCLICYPDRLPSGLGQVGTRRYMAPEVLEGAINFSRDSLTRIDMYACGLVLWEIISRCRGEDGTIVPEKYMLPFEEEVGSNPALEDMQETVCQAKKRPKLRDVWRKSQGLNYICEAIVECWDQDAEARLSSSCVLERVTYLMRTDPSKVV